MREFRVIARLEGRKTQPLRPCCFTEDDFWSLVEQTQEAGNEGCLLHMKNLRDLLFEIPNDEIIRFNRIYNKIAEDFLVSFEGMEIEKTLTRYPGCQLRHLVAWAIAQGKEFFYQKFSPAWVDVYVANDTINMMYFMSSIGLAAHFAYRRKNNGQDF